MWLLAERFLLVGERSDHSFLFIFRNQFQLQLRRRSVYLKYTCNWAHYAWLKNVKIIRIQLISHSMMLPPPCLLEIWRCRPVLGHFDHKSSPSVKVPPCWCLCGCGTWRWCCTGFQFGPDRNPCRCLKVKGKLKNWTNLQLLRFGFS